MPSVRHPLRLLLAVLALVAVGAAPAAARPADRLAPRLDARAVPGAAELTIAVTVPRLGSEPSLELVWRVERRGTIVAGHAVTLAGGLAPGPLARRWAATGLAAGRYVLVAQAILDRGPRSGTSAATRRLGFRLP